MEQEMNTSGATEIFMSIITPSWGWFRIYSLPLLTVGVGVIVCDTCG